MECPAWEPHPRDLRAGDLNLIRRAVGDGYGRGRSHITRRLCEHWEWRQANGQFKEYAARDLLLRLEEAGHILLPPRLRPKNNLKTPDFSQIPLFIQQPLAGRVGDHPAPRISLAEGPDRYLWDYRARLHLRPTRRELRRHTVGAPCRCDWGGEDRACKALLRVAAEFDSNAKHSGTQEP
ncbi:MAG: hypothetical protein KJ558_09275 [Gammaproteobacteria bacterium]|nr:hypothetical protein [Gammaproteobacteria bacterium]MBU1654998.1 hypothetical protein [Gammaproteobacteria bacterium]MBU1960019.1 hypothetical protein [Gammaproteobacteria bacterium]